MKKSNGELERDVIAELRWEPSVEDDHIRVTARDGIVTLDGHVPNYVQKLDAERSAKRVRGVVALANELEVRLPASLERDDTDIAEAAIRALQWSVAVPDQIVPTVSNGWVTLEGEVNWNFQRQAAYRGIMALTGVKGVVNKITVKPRVTPEQVKSKIEVAFERSARLDARRVKVTTEGGKVTLLGKVSSWSEYDDAANAAWSAPGVYEVSNRLTVEEEEPAFV